MTHIEGGGSGPSKLDERLEVFKDPKTDHVIVTPEEAKEILLERLLGFYRIHVEHPRLEIEALVRIAEAQGPEDKFDLTETVESIKKGAERNIEEREFEERIKKIVAPSKPLQAEI